MCKRKYQLNSSHILVGICVFFLVACERRGLSPVEIKIDDVSFNDSNKNQKNHDANYYTVLENENLFDIAYRYNIDPMHLAKINGINAPYKIRKGQLLKMPSEKTEIVIKDDDKEIPALDEKSGASEKSKKKDELEEEFEEVILNSNEKTLDSDEESQILSSPKITSPKKEVKTKENRNKKTEEANAKTKVVSKENGKMLKPVSGKVISGFGDIKDGISSDGISIEATLGTPVIASDDGTVIYIGNKLDEEYGNVIILQHKNNLISSYAHLDSMKVRKGQQVKAGEIIGKVGKTGDVSESQLYFEIMKDKKPVNPSKYLLK